jgi:hypothetical protein
MKSFDEMSVQRRSYLSPKTFALKQWRGSKLIRSFFSVQKPLSRYLHGTTSIDRPTIDRPTIDQLSIRRPTIDQPTIDRPQQLIDSLFRRSIFYNIDPPFRDQICRNFAIWIERKFELNENRSLERKFELNWTKIDCLNKNLNWIERKFEVDH